VNLLGWWQLLWHVITRQNIVRENKLAFEWVFSRIGNSNECWGLICIFRPTETELMEEMDLLISTRKIKASLPPIPDGL